MARKRYKSKTVPLALGVRNLRVFYVKTSRGTNKILLGIAAGWNAVREIIATNMLSDNLTVLES